jgi:hypothetical protein
MNRPLGLDGLQTETRFDTEPVEDLVGPLDVGIGMARFQGRNGTHTIAQLAGEQELGDGPPLSFQTDHITYPSFLQAGGDGWV